MGGDGLVWEGGAVSVSSENVSGAFDILPRHAQFITLIQDKQIDVHTALGDRRTFKFPRAVIYVYQDTVSIYAGI